MEGKYIRQSFRKAKGGIKVHTLFDVVTQIPTYIHITEAKVHDVNAIIVFVISAIVCSLMELIMGLATNADYAL